MKVKVWIACALFCCLGIGLAAADTLTPELKAKVEVVLKYLQSWGTDPKIVAAVKAYNANPPTVATSMTQDTWDKLSILSPEIKEFTKNELTTYLRTLKKDYISELFASGSNGKKVAFFSKTTSWNHTGKPKHDLPMTGKTWIGEPETDASTGVVQVQVSFPVLDAGKPIGSIVIGLQISKL